MAQRTMGTTRLRLHVSSSISNFKEKLLKRTGLEEYNPIRDMFRPVIFFGMYHPGDYLRAIFHFGRKKIFWCGADILALQRSIWKIEIRDLHAKHYCENTVEQQALREMGIEAEIRPMLFDAVDVPLSFTPSQRPSVYLCYRPGREKEYGVDKIDSLWSLFPGITFNKYDGSVPEEQFNESIKTFQAAIRLNKFDGFSEVLAKSALMGQYPISWIPYPHITHVYDAKSLRKALEELARKKEPNYDARRFWKKQLKENLYEVIS